MPRIPEHVRRLVLEFGGVPRQRRNNHWVIEFEGFKYYTSSTPSDWRTEKNARAQIRRRIEGR